MKRLFTYLGISCAILIGIVFLLIGILYAPWVQEYAKKQAALYVQTHYGMQLEVKRIHLIFPLLLAIDDCLLTSAPTDTLLACEQIRLDVRFLPLLNKKLEIRAFSLHNSQINFSNSLNGFTLAAHVGSLRAAPLALNLNNNHLALEHLALNDVDLDLATGNTSTPDSLSTTNDSLPWVFEVQKITFNRIRAHIDLPITGLQIDGQWRFARFTELCADLSKQNIRGNEAMIEDGNFSCRLAASGAKPETLGADTLSETSIPWEIAVANIRLQNDTLLWNNALQPVAKNGSFDSNRLYAESLSLEADSLFSKGSVFSVKLRALSTPSFNGLPIRRVSGDFTMAPERLSLANFFLQTAVSELQASAIWQGAFTPLTPENALQLSLRGYIGVADGLFFFPGAFPPHKRFDALPSLSMKATAEGSLKNLQLKQCDLNWGNALSLKAKGSIRDLLQPHYRQGSLQVDGNAHNLAHYLRGWDKLPVSLPNNFQISAKMGIVASTYSTSVQLTVMPGKCHVEGKFNATNQQYDLLFQTDQFPLYAFLPKTSLSALSMRGFFSGRNLDPFAEQARFEGEVTIDSLEQSGNSYRNITLRTSLDQHNIGVHLAENAPEANAEFSLAGILERNATRLRFGSTLHRANLQALGITSDSVSLEMQLNGSIALDLSQKDFAIELSLSKFNWSNGFYTLSVPQANTILTTNTQTSSLTFKSPGIDLFLQADEEISSLINESKKLKLLFDKQLQKGTFNLAELQTEISPIRLRTTISGKENILSQLLRLQGIRMQSFLLDADTQNPLRIRSELIGFSLSGQRIDTLRWGIAQDSTALTFWSTVLNAPTNPLNIASLELGGRWQNDLLQFSCTQTGKSGKKGFDLSCNTLLRDSLISFKVTTPHPILGFEPWNINADNHITYYRGEGVRANFNLHSGDRLLQITSQKDSLTTDSWNLILSGIHIASLLEILPIPPPIEGTITANASFRPGKHGTEVSGFVEIDSLGYNHQSIGKTRLNIDYKGNTNSEFLLLGDFQLNQKKLLTLEGFFTPLHSDSLGLSIAIDSLPLPILNPFLPENSVKLSGYLNNRLHIEGNLLHPEISGKMQLSEVTADVATVGTAYRFSQDTITIQNNKLLFDRYALYGPNKKPLYLNGWVDVDPAHDFRSEIELKASDFQIVNVPKNRKTLVYGKANVDLNVQAEGTPKNLSVLGNIDLLNNTEIVYTMRQSPLSEKENNKEMVTFVAFNDTNSIEEDTIPRLALGGLNILANITIGNAVKMAINLSENGENRINVEGGGNLSYSLNQLGDSRFSGRYNLTGGTVRYKPPVISEKLFKIQEGSYIEWNTTLSDPTLNITAIETIRTTVIENNNSRMVDFDIVIQISQTLENLSITFDVQTPGDLTLQNQLTSMGKEQRSEQAMSLLIYNTYTGPGTSAKRSTDPINTFIQKELNQWAGNYLKGVDISFDIDKQTTMNNGIKNTQTSYSYRVSKNLLNNRIRIIVGGGVNPDESTNENLTQNLIDDLSFQYMLNKQQNMYLTLFRESKYQNIVEGDVVQSGIGFVVRKKLKKLQSLFTLNEEKEARKEHARTHE